METYGPSMFLLDVKHTYVGMNNNIFCIFDFSNIGFSLSFKSNKLYSASSQNYQSLEFLQTSIFIKKYKDDNNFRNHLTKFDVSNASQGMFLNNIFIAMTIGPIINSLDKATISLLVGTLKEHFVVLRSRGLEILKEKNMFAENREIIFSDFILGISYLSFRKIYNKYFHIFEICGFIGLNQMNLIKGISKNNNGIYQSYSQYIESYSSPGFKIKWIATKTIDNCWGIVFDIDAILFVNRLKKDFVNVIVDNNIYIKDVQTFYEARFSNYVINNITINLGFNAGFGICFVSE